MMEEDEDQQLLAAAANWAGGDGDSDSASVDEEEVNDDSEIEADESIPLHKTRQNKTYSLHVTQLSYQASDFDIRSFFISKGCLVTSVRLVRSDGQFKGVAFVDVRDETSFQAALKCHRMVHLGRKINVRPVLSKEELSQIAQATKEKVQEIIQNSNSDSKNQEKTTTPPNKKTKKSRHHHHKDTDKKLSKKERNRKAAILAQKNKGKFVKKKKGGGAKATGKK